MTGWDYGNARVRAMRSRLLDSDGYRDLLRARSIRALLGALATTAYRRDVEAALARTPDLRRFDEVLRLHASRVLHALPSWYAGDARRAVERMLARWDWRNLRTVLRSVGHHLPAEEIEPLVVPAGAIGTAMLRDLARQPSIPAAVEKMRAWGLPTRGLLGSEPLAALDRLWAPVLDVDRLNVMTALRLRAARFAEGVDAREEFLPGGTIDERVLDDLAHARTHAEARALLPDRLGDWRPGEELPALSDRLEVRALRNAVRGFVRGDPLGPAIPRAFVAAKELEMRNLRTISRGIEAHRLPTEIERELVVA